MKRLCSIALLFIVGSVLSAGNLSASDDTGGHHKHHKHKHHKHHH